MMGVIQPGPQAGDKPPPYAGIVFILVLTLFFATPAHAGGLPAGEIRALYGLDRKLGPLRGKSSDQVARWLVDHRFNAVFGGFRDRALVRALRRRGIKVYAEVPLFVGRKQWRQQGGRPVTDSGRLLKKHGWYAGVCPNQPWLRAQKLRYIQRLVRTFKVDGVWLDFIRYPARWETAGKVKLPQTCFCRQCLEQLRRRTGLKLPKAVKDTSARARWILSNHRPRWISFKTSRIVDFVKKARITVKKEDPTAVVGLFGVPWKVSEHNGAIRAVIGQDFTALAPWVDVFSPMVYHRMQGQRPAWIAGHVAYLNRLTGKPVLPIIQACSVPGRLSDAEFSAAVVSARRQPSRGVVVFSMKHFVREKRGGAWLEAVQAPPRKKR